jgi:protein arginine kinase activator
MLCENCGQRPATIHQTVIINGQKQESHLCEVCAQESGQFAFPQSGFSFPNLSINDLLSSFLGQTPFSSPVAPPQAEPRCSNCGMTFSQFSETGFLGCAQCYEHMDRQLTEMIKRIHGTTTHTGKVPKRTGGIAAKRREQALLKQQLQAAIQQEDYEEAARVRDKIKEMETQIQAGGEGNAVE